MYALRTILLALFASLALVSAKSPGLQIGVKHKPDSCPIKSRKGDKLSMQWVGAGIPEVVADQQLHWYSRQRRQQV